VRSSRCDVHPVDNPVGVALLVRRMFEEEEEPRPLAPRDALERQLIVRDLL
jgi:hypothetical protein